MRTITKLFAGAVLCVTGLATQAFANQVDILAVGDKGTVNGAIFAGTEQHVGGTGVFSPFLSLQNSPIEEAYNAGNGKLWMDNTRPNWNSQLHVGDLQKVNVGGADYYLFALDANEPGNDKSFISIDNIRIYTSKTDTSITVKGNESQLDKLGVVADGGAMRYAMNEPLKSGGTYNAANWVNLDSRLGTEPAGSGLYDMLAYIPVSSFAGAADSDFLWFFNLNGVHVGADGDLASQAGFEEWRAFTGPSFQTPDGGTTLALLGLALAGAGIFRKCTEK